MRKLRLGEARGLGQSHTSQSHDSRARSALQAPLERLNFQAGSGWACGSEKPSSSGEKLAKENEKKIALEP